MSGTKLFLEGTEMWVSETAYITLGEHAVCANKYSSPRVWSICIQGLSSTVSCLVTGSRRNPMKLKGRKGNADWRESFERCTYVLATAVPNPTI